MKIKAGIIGGGGYVGAELARILLNHPNAELVGVGSRSDKGAYEDTYPGFRNICNLDFTDNDDVIAKSDVVFASVPHGVSEEFAEKAHAKKAVFIDMGADFRLRSEADYSKWYGCAYNKPHLHEISCYGLPELNREQIKTCDIIGNPGCYPTSIALGLMPAISAGAVEKSGIIIDSKSGTTGAGIGLTRGTHFAECNEAFAPYKAAAHRHIPEIEQTLSDMAKEQVSVTFVPHLLPINRGIVSTIYARTEKSLEEIFEIYSAAYENEKFVRLLPLGSFADLKNVRLSNFCDISLHKDEHTNTLIIVSAIDNMVKGAAGQAVQNMNIRFGLPEDAGLNLITPAF